MYRLPQQPKQMQRGECVRFSISTVTITADAKLDTFVETAANGGMDGGLACAPNGTCVIGYDDADDDLGCVVGSYLENRVIDIRSATASITAEFDLEPVFDGKPNS